MSGMNEIIQTMFQQFGGNRAMVMIGGKPLFYSNKENMIAFSFKMFPRSNILRLSYNLGMDTYTMEFIKSRMRDSLPYLETYKKVEGLFAEDLQRVFIETTGLYLSL